MRYLITNRNCDMAQAKKATPNFSESKMMRETTKPTENITNCLSIRVKSHAIDDDFVAFFVFHCIWNVWGIVKCTVLQNTCIFGAIYPMSHFHTNLNEMFQWKFATNRIFRSRKVKPQNWDYLVEYNCFLNTTNKNL